MSSYKPADSKREEFRKYLEKAGVLDTLTKVLVGLYEEPEKPDNALEFIKKHMQAEGPDPAEVEAMKVELAELRQKVELLEAENMELKRGLNTAAQSHATSTAPGQTPIETS
ncbi:C-myc binding protein [Paragonimus skrjabini miyazakii]|uniref:C-myc binding protein n=1 Tax=Paragonimus skrjabini miyazakii TaxID=59628 RepID=A0A8S9YRN1_9TREM|nr:C-myc binding protein [Paragonimus skrjabini miyazakii]